MPLKSAISNRQSKPLIDPHMRAILLFILGVHMESRAPPHTCQDHQCLPPLAQMRCRPELSPLPLGVLLPSRHAQMRIVLTGTLRIGGKGGDWDMICQQLEIADILKSLLLSSFRFRVFLYLSFKGRTANPVIGFLPRTEYTLMGCQGLGRCGTPG